MLDEYTYYCDKYDSVKQKNDKNGCQVSTKKDTRFTNEAAGGYESEFMKNDAINLVFL